MCAVAVCVVFIVAAIVQGVGFAAAVTFVMVMAVSVVVPFIAINEDQRDLRPSEQARRHNGLPQPHDSRRRP